MKKIFLFLSILISFFSYGQAEFPEGVQIIGGQPTNTTPTFLTATSPTGLQEKIPSAYIEKTANKTSTISGYSETLYLNEKASHDALDLKLNISDLPTNLTLYPTTTASDVSGYVVMVKDIHDVRYNTTAVDVSTPTITTTDQLVSQRISDAGILIGQPGVFNITTFGNIRHLSGSGTATFYFKVFHRDSLGVETLICTSSISNPVTDGGYSEFTASGVWDDGDFVASDRIVIKSYANRIAGGSDPVYQFQFGGTSPVRTLLPVPFSVVDAGYELSANKQNSLAIDGTGTKYPTVDAVNAIDLQKVIDVNGFAELPNSGGSIGIYYFNEEGEDTGTFSVNLKDSITSSTTTILAVKNLLDIESSDSENSSRIEISPLDFRLTKRTFVGGDFNTSVIFNEPVETTTLNFPAKTVAGDYTLATTDDVDAKITQTITNGVTDKSPSEDAVFDALANVTRNIISNTTTGSTITGTISQTVLFSQLIPANTFKSGGFLNIMMSRVGKIGTLGTLTQTIRINTTNTLTGATIIASTLGSTANLNHVLSRRFSIEGTNLKGFAGGSAPSDMINSSAAIETYAFDPTINNYIFEVGQLSSALDSMFHSSFLLTN